MDKILDYIMEKIQKKEDLTQEYIDYIRYGVDGLLSTLVNIICILAVGIILGKIYLTLVFVAVFVPVRSFTGGYHADTRVRCNFSTMLILILTISGTGWIMKSGLEIFFLIGFHLTFLICFFLLAPVEHHNKPLTLEKKKKNKLLGGIAYLVVLAAEWVSGKCFPEIQVYLACVLFGIGVFMILGTIKHNRYKRMQQNVE